MTQTTVHPIIDLGTKVHDAVDLGTKQLGVINTGTSIVGEGLSTTTTNLGLVQENVHIGEGQVTTNINQAIDMGTKVLPPVAGSTVNLGAIGGETQLTTTNITTTTTNQGAGFGVEGSGLVSGIGAVGYGTTSQTVGNAGASAIGQFGVEGSSLGGNNAVGYGTTSINQGNAGMISGLGGNTQTTTTTTVTTTTNNIGGSQMVNTLTPSFLPNAFNSIPPEQIIENNQQINA